MRKLFNRARALAVAAFCASAAAATHVGATDCVVYEGGGYRGAQLALEDGKGYDRLNRWSDRISSILLKPGCALEIGEDWDFGGRRVVVRENVPFMGPSWNNRVSAISCGCRAAPDRKAAAQPAIGDGSPPPIRFDGFACVVFDAPSFKGPWRAFKAGNMDRPLGKRLKEKVSSVRVAKGCVAMLDGGWGFKLWADEDVRTFGDLNNQADSVSCFCP